MKQALQVYPACVYGFFMYLVIVAVAVAGLVAGRRSRTGAVGGKNASRGEPLRALGLSG
jgi:hypothetical protein